MQKLTPDMDINYSFSPDILMDINHDWLHRTVEEPEEEVWLTREDVANGVDTVAKAALDWIESEN